MSDDRFAADVPALMQGAADIDRIAARVRDLTFRLNMAIAVNQDAVAGSGSGAGGGYRGGGVNAGEFGPIWFDNYKPGEEAALRFLDLLNWGVGLTGNRARDVGRVFDNVDNEASGEAGSVR